MTFLLTTEVTENKSKAGKFGGKKQQKKYMGGAAFLPFIQPPFSSFFPSVSSVLSVVPLNVLARAGAALCA
jgi:hypothetical protein